MVPIVWSLAGDESPHLYVKPLKEVIGAKEEELPKIFLYHGMSGTTFRYPEPMDDPSLVSPELVILWAKREMAEKERDMFEERIKQDDEEEDPEEKIEAELLTALKERLDFLRTEAVELKEAEAEMKKLFAEGTNTFSDYVDHVHDLGLLTKKPEKS